jgi:hypothetical protein
MSDPPEELQPRIFVERRRALDPPAPAPAPAPAPDTPSQRLLKWMPLLVILVTATLSMLGALALRSFTAGQDSVREEVADRERVALTANLDALTKLVAITTQSETNQGFINRQTDDLIKELAEHVHELDGRASQLTSRADISDGRFGVLGDRLQQYPLPSVGAHR